MEERVWRVDCVEFLFEEEKGLFAERERVEGRKVELEYNKGVCSINIGYLVWFWVELGN